MIEAGAPSTGKLERHCPRRARPTGGNHGRTTESPAQRRGGAKAKAALQEVRAERSQQQYKGRSPKAPPEVLEDLDRCTE
jgi:hypothetical protein